MIVWKNGSLVDPGAAVSAADRGYLVGDGVFETMLVSAGKPAFLGAHLARLRRGAAVMDFRASFDEDAVRGAIADLAGRLDLQGPAVCRMTVTRSGGARGLAPSRETSIETLIALHPAPAKTPVFRTIVAQTRRYSGAATNAFKCMGAYAPNLLARMEAARAGAAEAIMLNERGRVACASAANVFLLSERDLTTPPESEGATPGVTRAVLIEIARELGAAVRVEPVSPDALTDAAVILTNSVIGVAHAEMSAPAAPQPMLASRVAALYEQRVKSEFSRRPA